ncbi:MAG: ArnT family glycosyltransferase [Aeromicrobium sp.]
MAVLTQRGERRLAGLGTPLQGSMLRWLALCAGISIALRLPFLDTPLGIDEGGDSFVAREWGTTQGSMYGGSWLDRPPLLVMLYKVGVLGGDHGVRVLGMVAAILLIAGTMAIAHHLGGARAARITGLITAVMTSSVVLGAIFTNNELLAAVPATFSIFALVRARDSDRAWSWLFGSGFLASCAFLIKQSFVEALVAGGVFLLVGWAIRHRKEFRVCWVFWWVAGVLAPVLATLAWFQLNSVGIRTFLYAIAGFRLDSLTLQYESQGASYMLVHLGIPIAIASGILLPVPWAASWLLARRSDPQLVLPLTAWLGVGVVGITGGGYYFPHYFIQPLAALAVLAGCALAVTSRRRLSAATAALFLVLSVGNVAVGTTLQTIDPPQQRTLAVAKYLRANAHPDDNLYVVYARANLLYYADMPTPYPYLWSTMVRAVPGAEKQLRDTLSSPALRPTWIVEWQQPTAFGLDRSRETSRLIERYYVQVNQICGKPILIRRDQAARMLRSVPQTACAQLEVPGDIGPFDQRSPSDSAEYLWQ